MRMSFLKFHGVKIETDMINFDVSKKMKSTVRLGGL